KLALLQLEKKEKEEYDYLKILKAEYPEDDTVKQRLFLLDAKINSDRIGLNYSYTAFSRENYGPWHLAGLQYIRERKWGSLIGRINYADRLSSGKSISDGIQYEAESYFFTGQKSYSYAGIAYSSDLAFPRLRLGYSYFQNFNNGWEADLGFRFTDAAGREFKTGVAGIGKYLGSFWLHFRTYMQNEKKDFYPAFAITARYYFDTRFDYAAIILGYGTSPDERTVLGQFDQRVALSSYRFGLGYFRLLGSHFITGIQAAFNRQEYAPDARQNEYEIAAQLQYKF
ncbi:MAG TPA: YaiO family outer membrane beta-barrel protein, partial [Flavobacterium sp.]|nr:YaiO family outer membrane beta-barrel protein [Flavobacterium sp.]